MIPKNGVAFLSVRDADKHRVVDLAQSLMELGFKIIATEGTANALQKFGVVCETVFKVNEGRPHIVDMIKNDQINFIVNTTEGEQAIADSFAIRRNAVQHKVCYYTTVAGGKAACASLNHDALNNIIRLQDLHKM